MKKEIDDILFSLSKSKFRKSFKLGKRKLLYINKVGMRKIGEHAFDFVNKRIRNIAVVNDGKQTPMKGHPVFIEHATATCCRGCIEKWHHIDRRKVLDDFEVRYIVMVIMAWINNEVMR